MAMQALFQFLGNDDYTPQTQILNVDTLEWREGGPTPGGINAPGYASSGRTVYLTGGSNPGDYYDWILEWDPDNEVWSQRGETLSLERAYMGAVFLTDDKFECYAIE